MDNCPSHVTDEALRLLLEARVRVIIWSPHMTQIFQQLDVSLFGVLKWRGQYKLPFDEEDGTHAFLFKISRASKQTMIETDIWGAFSRGEIWIWYKPWTVLTLF
jgi:hypothetical protein